MNVLKLGCRYLWLEIVYIILTSIYLFLLNGLNVTLLKLYDKDEYISILAYNNFQPVWFFLVALIFILFGIGISIYRFKKIKNSSLEMMEALFSLLSIVIMIFIIILIFIFIDNPIMRAVFGVMSVVFVMTALSD